MSMIFVEEIFVLNVYFQTILTIFFNDSDSAKRFCVVLIEFSGFLPQIERCNVKGHRKKKER